MTTVAPAAGIALALAAGGCGSSGSAGSAASSTAPAPRLRALTQSDVLSVRLGTPRAGVLARLGPPSAGGPPSADGDRCLYWRISGQPATASWRLCFRAGRLRVLSAYAG